MCQQYALDETHCTMTPHPNHSRRQTLLRIYPLSCNGEEEEACGPFADHECAVVRQAFKQQNRMVQKCQYCTIFMQLKS